MGRDRVAAWPIVHDGDSIGDRKCFVLADRRPHALDLDPDARREYRQPVGLGYKDEFKNPKEGVSRSTLLREGKLPHIRIGEIKVHGPIVEEADGGNEEMAVFGSKGFQADRALEQLYAFGTDVRWMNPIARGSRLSIGNGCPERKRN